MIDGQSGVGDDAAERAGPDLLVVGDDGPGVGHLAAQDHVASGLAAEHEPGPLESGADVPAGQVGGELGQVAAPTVFLYAASTSTNSLPASVGIGSPASRNPRFHRNPSPGIVSR